MGALCGLFGRSKQAYYKRDWGAPVSRAARESFVVEYVRSVRSEDPGIGGVKLWRMYSAAFKDGRPFGRDAFMTIVSDNGLKLRRRKRRPRTTDSGHGLPVYPNLARGFLPEAPDRLWVSDITYIPLCPESGRPGFCYLSLVLDAYTEEIVGWSLGATLEARHPLEALRMALRRVGDRAEDLVHHSDRGCQYASLEYVLALRSRGIRISMCESGDPRENAQAERVNGTMKNELLKGMRFKDVESAREAVRKAVEFYNTRRPHMSIDMKTPAQAAACAGRLRKRWRSLREEAIKNMEDNGRYP